jgi:multiple sugar transport system substrate-binding protein
MGRPLRVGLALLFGLGGCGSSGLAPARPDAPAAGDLDGDRPMDAPPGLAADAAEAAAEPRDVSPEAPDLAPDARDASGDLGPTADAPDAGDAGARSDGAVAADAPDAAEDPTPAATLTFWRHDNPAFARAEDQAFADYMASQPRVTIVPTTTSWPMYTGALASDLARDQFGYDFVLMPPSATCTYAANLDEVPADVASLAEAQNTFLAAPLEGSTCGGKLKALPVEYNLEYGGVVVNLDRYQEKFPGRQPGWPSWSTFLAEASALSRFDSAGKPCTNGLDIDPDWPEPVRHIFLSQILQRGGHYWSGSDPRLFDFATPEARASLAEMVAWVNRDKVLSTALLPVANTFVTIRLARGATGYGCGDDVSQPLSVMGYAGTWALPATIAERPPGAQTHFDYFSLPPMVGTRHEFVQNAGFALAVARTSKNRRAAWDVIKAIALSPTAMRKWAATAGTLPALRVNATPQAAASDPLLAKIQPLLERGRWMGQIPYGATDTVLGTMVSNYFAAVRGIKTVDQALKDMQDTANQAILRNQ